MKNKVITFTMSFILLILLSASNALAGNASGTNPSVPFGTAFTYQGQLKDGSGKPVDDSCDFLFSIFLTETGGSPLITLDITGVEVDKGYFTVLLDTTYAVYADEARWLEAAVKCSGDVDYITLTPRQALMATPYAMNADTLDGLHYYELSGVNHTHWGQTWTGSVTGLTLSSNTIGISASGSIYGIYSSADTTTGAAGYFSNTSGSGIDRGWALLGFSGSGGFGDIPAGVLPAAAEFAGPNGVIGAASTDDDSGRGVLGFSGGINGVGVYGRASSWTGDTSGVFGTSLSSLGTGVFGYGNSATGNNFGVQGWSASSEGTGVYGYASNIAGYSYGVYGETASPNGIGVYGEATNTGGPATGVYGTTQSVGGYGLFGLADNNSAGPTCGVYGRSDSPDGFGIAGHAYYSGVGVGAWSYSGNLIEAYSGDYPGGTLRMYLSQAGNLYIDGTYNTYLASSLDGEEHAISSVQSTEDWIEDFGRGELVKGEAFITIAPDFAGVADLSQEYMVFVTLEGDCQGVYISSKTSNTFEVHELNGGTSSAPFAYRIVAKPVGSGGSRLPMVDIPASIVVDRSDEILQTPDSPQPDLPSNPVVPPVQGEIPN